VIGKLYIFDTICPYALSLSPAAGTSLVEARGRAWRVNTPSAEHHRVLVWSSSRVRLRWRGRAFVTRVVLCGVTERGTDESHVMCVHSK
jgi:hypothetical protein